MKLDLNNGQFVRRLVQYESAKSGRQFSVKIYTRNASRIIRKFELFKIALFSTTHGVTPVKINISADAVFPPRIIFDQKLGHFFEKFLTSLNFGSVVWIGWNAPIIKLFAQSHFCCWLSLGFSKSIIFEEKWSFLTKNVIVMVIFLTDPGKWNWFFLIFSLEVFSEQWVLKYKMLMNGTLVKYIWLTS